jgi:hypothetical protein
MAVIEDLVQEVVISGGYVCFWVGPSRSNAQLCSIRLYGTVTQASNNGAAVSLLLTAQLCQLEVSVTTDASNRITKIACRQSSVDLSSVADDSPYAARNHNHAGVYSPVGHNHDGVYSPVGHNHDGVYSPVGHNHDGVYAAIAHNHDHNALINRLAKEHTLAIQTVLVRAVPLGIPLRELLLADAEFGMLRAELGANPAVAYSARNGITSVAALVEDGGVVQRVLAGIMVLNTGAADLRWDLRLYYTGSEAEYTRPTGGSTENVRLFVTTHLDAS